jgi:hypothetical protein
MRLSHPSAILALLFVAAAAIGVSCSFPDIVFFESPSGAATGSGGDSATSSSAASTGDGATSSSTASTGGGGNGSASSSSSSSSSGSGASSSSSGGTPTCGSDPCDCDDDGEKSFDCGGPDCADYDKRANSKAGFLLDSMSIIGPRKSGTPGFDFNCNGQQQKQFGVVDCVSVVVLGCTGDGFTSDTACGQEGTLVHCGAVGLNLCTKLPNPPMQFQGCH